MPYSPSYSYNYNVPNINLSDLMSQGFTGASDLMNQRYAGEGELQDARLQNALELARMGYGSAAELQKGQIGEAGRQFDVTTGLTKEQQQWLRDKAIRDENWSRSLQNPENILARAQVRALPDPQRDAMIADMEKRRKEAEMWSTPTGGYFPGSFMRNYHPSGYAGFGGRNVMKA